MTIRCFVQSHLFLITLKRKGRLMEGGVVTLKKNGGDDSNTDLPMGDME